MPRSPQEPCIPSAHDSSRRLIIILSENVNFTLFSKVHPHNIHPLLKNIPHPLSVNNVSSMILHKMNVNMNWWWSNFFIICLFCCHFYTCIAIASCVSFKKKKCLYWNKVLRRASVPVQLHLVETNQKLLTLWLC